MIKEILISTIFTTFILLVDYLITGSFSYLGGILFFLLILFVTLFYQRFIYLYLLMLFTGTLHHLFFSYFQRSITGTDLYLFFTHTEESFESFYPLLKLFVLPLSLSLLGVVLLLLIRKINLNTYPIKSWIKYSIFVILLLLNLNTTMGLQLLSALSTISWSQNKHQITNTPPLYPLRDANYNIILLLGESMKYNPYIESKLKNQGFFYKKIFSGATNTDVAIPLLLNNKTNPLELNPKDPNSLFVLAKRNDFNTTFISIQTEKSLQYIKPYLSRTSIDHYKTYSKEERSPQFDFLLLEQLKKINYKKKNFIVLEQIGQHSPYHYFEGDIGNKPQENYRKSVDYSFKLYASIYKLLQKSQKPFVFIYVSDHGEFTGEGGKWGHNSFDPLIYQVPFFIVTNIQLPKSYQAIKSHYHLSQLLIYLLGYQKTLELSEEKSIVNGTMLSREDGFIRVE